MKKGRFPLFVELGHAWLLILGLPMLPTGARAQVPQTYYVNVANPTPVFPYTSWDTAATNIQDAVDAASVGAVVVVTNGVYSTGGRAVAEMMTNRLAMDRPMTVRSVNGPAVTAIEGAPSVSGGNGDGAVRCAYLGAGAVLSGFTLQHGHTRTVGRIQDWQAKTQRSGGGAWCEASGVLTNCVLTGNSADGIGGGVFRGTLHRCIITRNWSWASSGGANESTLYNCVLTANSSEGIGGGEAGSTLYNCILTANSAPTGGGSYGGTLYNCTLTGNLSGDGGGGGARDSTLRNCIVYFNEGGNYRGGTFEYSCTSPLPTGPGNIEADPQLTSDCHLCSTSPCIAAGSSEYANGVDMDGDEWADPPSMGVDEVRPGQVTGPLSLGIRASATETVVGNAVTLTAQLVGSVTKFIWDFGDGTTATKQVVVSHIWGAPGVYTVRLTAFNDGFPDGKTATLIVKVAPFGAVVIVIPEVVTQIEDGAFLGFTELVSVVISGSVISIGDRAFSNCSGLTSVTIPRSVARIGSKAFMDCTGLTNVTIENGDTYILENAFSGCTSLTTIVFGDSVFHVGSSVVLHEGHLFHCYTDPSGVASSAGFTTIITGYDGSGGEVSLPESINETRVTGVGARAFEGCANLTSLIIPDSVTSIGFASFIGCSSLASLTIPNSVRNLGDGAFRHCTSLASVSIGNGVPRIGEYAFADCSNLTTVTIGNGVTSIAGGAFKGCPSLTRVTIPNSVTSIGEAAFLGCSGLTTLMFGNGVTRIESLAFSGCTGLSFVAVPNSVTGLGWAAFSGCSSLTRVAIGSGVTNIEDSVFSDCANLASMSVDVLNPAYSSLDGVLFDKSHAFLIQYPTAKAGAYNVPDSVTSIGGAAFSGASQLTHVTIPDGVTSIGDQAFSRCSGLSGATIGAGVTAIGEGTFSGCTNLGSVHLPDSVTNLGRAVFSGCTGVTNLTIGNGVTNIGGEAFRDCSSLVSITIPARVTGIEAWAFFGCTSLQQILVDPLNTAYSSVDGVLFDISRSVLIRCPEGKAGPYEIPAGTTEILGDEADYKYRWNDGAFEDCRNLTRVMIPDGVTSIGDNAFSGCGSLTRVVIPRSVTWVGQAFTGCTKLRGVYFEGDRPLCYSSGVGDEDLLHYYIPGSDRWHIWDFLTAPWLPEVQTAGPGFGMGSNGFGFTINWASGKVVVIEASSDLGNPTWSAMSTNLLAGNLSYFSDPDRVNHSRRFYRVRSP